MRTLRDLGVDLGTVQRVLDREIGVGDVAAAHAEALDVQIRTLRLRRAVLRAVAKRGSTPEEIELMHKLARLSDEERKRIITDFIDESFAGLDVNPDFEAKLRSALPDLPDDPEPEQVDAWVELAELVGDPDFRAAIRRMAEHQAADIEKGSYPEDPARLGQLTGRRSRRPSRTGSSPVRTRPVPSSTSWWPPTRRPSAPPTGPSSGGSCGNGRRSVPTGARNGTGS